MRSRILIVGVAIGIFLLAQINFELAVLLLVLAVLWWWWNNHNDDRYDDYLEEDIAERTARTAGRKATDAANAAEAVVQVTEDRMAATEAVVVKTADIADEAPSEADTVEDMPQDTTTQIIEENAGDNTMPDDTTEAEDLTSEAGDTSHAPPLEDAAQAIADEPDDLLRIEGIGPYYRDLLLGVGINTYAKLAAMSAGEIEQAIIKAGGRRSASISTWAEQAALAAQNDWDALNALQDELKGGRRDN